MFQGFWNVMRKIFKYIPQRYVLGIMGFLAITNAYQMRVCLSIAIVEMVVKPDTSNSSHADTCSEYYTPTNVTEGDNGNELFDWSEPTQGLILGSFYWGYIITHIPGGLLADRFGGKYTLGVGILMTAIFTLLVPVASEGGVGWLIAARIITGLGEGTTYPAINDLLARWIPADERALIGSLVYAGSQIGTVTGTLISGTLLKHYEHNWKLVFYFFGVLGILWFIFWQLLCYSDPQRHPFITEKERSTLMNKIPLKPKKGPMPPWKHIFTSLPIWGLIGAQVGHDWGFYTMVTDLPKYMNDVLFYDIGTNGFVSSLPYIVMWIVSVFAGWLCDFIIKRKWLTVTKARKIFTSIAHIGPSIGIIAASYAGCDRTAVVVLFTVAMGFMGTFYPGMKVNGIDLSPNYAGTIMAITNGLGAITGIITPYLVGVLTGGHTVKEWRTVYWITFGVNMVTLVMFVTMGSGNTQYWNNPDNLINEDDKERSQVHSDLVEADETQVKQDGDTKSQDGGHEKY